jgi:hypothetical protein
MAIVLQLCFSPRGASTFVFVFKRRGYKKGNRVGYNMISIRTLSLFIYFTYIFYRYNYLYLEEHVMVF